MTTDQAPPVARTSERGAATRSGLLTAAREVFTSAGYAQAGVMEIVTRAGASVGSLYHHFSGKADLYGTLFEEFHRNQAECTRLAVRRARDEGISDPRQLFLAGARGYLDCCVEQRELSALFVRGDGPPGFDLVRRERLVEWSGRNAEYFARSGEPLDTAVSIVMTGALMLAVAEISLSPDAEQARRIVNGVIQVLSRIEFATT